MPNIVHTEASATGEPKDLAMTSGCSQRALLPTRIRSRLRSRPGLGDEMSCVSGPLGEVGTPMFAARCGLPVIPSSVGAIVPMRIKLFTPGVLRYHANLEFRGKPFE